jgi:hypothetical protein
MKEAEAKGENLQTELKALEYQEKNTFKSPPEEWIDHRLEEFHGTLSKNTTAAALALKEVLGEIRMEAVTDEGFDPESIINGLDPSTRPSASLRMTGEEIASSPSAPRNGNMKKRLPPKDVHKRPLWPGRFWISRIKGYI